MSFTLPICPAIHDPSIHPILHGKNVSVGHCTQTVWPTFSYLPCLYYRHYWLLPFCTTFSDLDRGWGSQGQRKAKPIGFILRNLFIWSGWKLMWCLSNSSWTSWDYLWLRFIETRGITAVLLTVSKDLTLACIRMFVNRFDSNSVWWYVLLNFILILV